MKKFLIFYIACLTACSSNYKKPSSVDLVLVENKNLDSEISSLKTFAFFLEQDVSASVSLLNTCLKNRHIFSKEKADFFFVRKSLKTSSAVSHSVNLVKNDTSVDIRSEFNKLDLLNFYRSNINALEVAKSSIDDALVECRYKSSIESASIPSQKRFRQSIEPLVLLTEEAP